MKKNLPSITCYPFLFNLIFAVLSFSLINNIAFCGGWKSIGPTTGANAHVRSFAINSFSHKMYATTDSGMVRRDYDSSWSMIQWNYCWGPPFDKCESFYSVWSHPLIDSAWFFGSVVSYIEPGPTLSFGTLPENPWSVLYVSWVYPTVFSLTFHPTIPSKLYSNNKGFCVSNDTGKTWICQDSPTFWPWLRVLAIDQKLTDKVYAFGQIISDSIVGLYRTTNDGVTWSFVSAQDPVALLANSDTLLSTSPQGIILSTNAGTSWIQVLLENITSTVRHPQQSHLLFAGSFSGVIYRSTNGGANWDLYNTTLPSYPITQLGFDGTSDTLYAGTDGAGIFQVYDISVGVNESPGQLPTEFKLYPAYPNPFNPSTTIAFDLPERMDVRVEVFNVVGQKMATIFDGVKEAGNYSMPINVASWSSGVYLVRMNAMGRTKTQSIVLTR